MTVKKWKEGRMGSGRAFNGEKETGNAKKRERESFNEGVWQFVEVIKWRGSIGN